MRRLDDDFKENILKPTEYLRDLVAIDQGFSYMLSGFDSGLNNPYLNQHLMQSLARSNPLSGLGEATKETSEKASQTVDSTSRESVQAFEDMYNKQNAYADGMWNQIRNLLKILPP